MSSSRNQPSAGHEASTPSGASERLTAALDIATLYSGGITYGDSDFGVISFADIRHLIEQRDEAMREATELAKWLHRRFYSDVTTFRLFDNPASVISQIDNMVAGLANKADALEAALAAATGHTASQSGPLAERDKSREEQ